MTVQKELHIARTATRDISETAKAKMIINMMIADGHYTNTEIVSVVLLRCKRLQVSTVRSLLSHAKNPRYSAKERQVKVDPVTKLLCFAEERPFPQSVRTKFPTKAKQIDTRRRVKRYARTNA